MIPHPSDGQGPAVPDRRSILRLAWPIVLANSAVPLLGLVDTAVIGNLGSVVGLGAIALGAIVFNVVYWSFGFLRMGTTGFTAQASGVGDHAEVRATLGRALLVAAGIGTALIVLQRPIAWAALSLLGASAEVEAMTRSYFDVRIWGAPATLGTYAILGLFVGLGRTGYLLIIQLVLNGMNIGLDILFAGVMAWGVPGIAMGTAISEWVAFLIALAMAAHILRGDHRDTEAFWPWPRVLDAGKALRTLGAHADIMVRTLLLLLGLAWFADRGARFGDTILAANHVLLQLIAASAYLLDGYAHATEVLVGRAVAVRARDSFRRGVRAATELAAASGVVLAVAVLVAGPWAIAALTDLEGVRGAAGAFLPYAAVYVLVSFAAFQLDGIFIGATWTRAMRNASVISFAVFILLSLLLVPIWGNTGLWIAFVGFVLARAAALGWRYPALVRQALD